MRKAFIFGILILLSISFCLGAGTYTISGSGDKNFKVNAGEKVISNEFYASTSKSNVRVYLNGKYQGDVGSIEGLKNEDFINYFKNKNRWEGENKITFSDDIDYFSLNYTTEDILSDVGSFCISNLNCKRGVCIRGVCCDQNPIQFAQKVSSSCKGSKIPIQVMTVCKNLDKEDLKDVAIDFYLGSERMNEINESSQREIKCTTMGGTGWDIDGEIRCGTRNIPLSPGRYVLKANYTIDGIRYDVIINNSFLVEAECSRSQTCHHVGSFNDPSSISFGNPKEKDSNLVYENNVIIVPYNAYLYVDGIKAFVAQCSNGVRYSLIPGFVSWSDGPDGYKVSDSLKNCNVRGVTRSDIFGPNYKSQGYGHSECSLSLTHSNEDNVSLREINKEGHYVIKVDMVNAICDAPSYICPNRNISDKGDGICGVGTRKFSNGWYLQDGWNGNAKLDDQPYKEYEVLAVKPKIEYEQKDISQSNERLDVLYYFNNTGIGKVNVSIRGADMNFYYNFSSLILTEKSDFEKVLSIYPLYRKYEHPISDFISLNSNYKVDWFNFSNYLSRELGDNYARLNYTFKYDITYDDGYGFKKISPVFIPQSFNYTLNFNCSPQNYGYILGFQDFDYYCTCSDGKFFKVYRNFTYDRINELFDISQERGICLKKEGIIPLNIRCGSNITLGSKRQIQVFSDSDKGNITIGKEFFRNIERGLTNFEYTFDKAGTIYVELNYFYNNGKVRENSNIIVIDLSKNRKYVAACIDSPRDLSNISGKTVFFNSTSTRGISVENGVLKEIPKEKMIFIWSFSDKSIFIEEGTNTRAYLFFKDFLTPGNNWARLEVKLI